MLKETFWILQTPCWLAKDGGEEVSLKKVAYKDDLLVTQILV